MSRQRKINVEDAKIKTASVEIKAISINGKQMTLAVFKQVPDEDIIDNNTYQLKGIPWGLVNYFPHKEIFANVAESIRPRIHVLWQKGNELRKCVLVRYREEKNIGELIKETPVKENKEHGFYVDLAGEPINKKAEERYRLKAKSYNNLFDQLSQLDQLFIAV